MTKSELTQALEQANNLVSENENLQARVKELEDMNAPGLVKQINELKNTNAQLTTDLNAKQNEINEKNTFIDQLQTERDGLQAQIDSNDEYVQHLEEELTRANEAVSAHEGKTQKAVEEARTIGGE